MQNFGYVAFMLFLSNVGFDYYDKSLPNIWTTRYFVDVLLCPAQLPNLEASIG